MNNSVSNKQYIQYTVECAYNSRQGWGEGGFKGHDLQKQR